MECEHNILRRPKHCYDIDEYHCRKCDTYFEAEKACTCTYEEKQTRYNEKCPHHGSYAKGRAEQLCPACLKYISKLTGKWRKDKVCKLCEILLKRMAKEEGIKE